MKKVIFLDHDGVICLSHNWGTRHTKQRKWGKRKMSMDVRSIPIEYRFDNFDKKQKSLYLLIGNFTDHWKICVSIMNLWVLLKNPWILHP